MKDAHDVVKSNPFLSDEDFKEIMNSSENYRIMSKSDNTAKGDGSDWSKITDMDHQMTLEARARTAQEKIRADVMVYGRFTIRTAENIGKLAVSGGTDALVNSAIPLTVTAVNKMVQVAQGKVEFNEAAQEVGQEIVEVAVVGGANRIISQGLSKVILNPNQVSEVVTIALIVKDAAVRYIDGELTAIEFIEEVGEKGVIMTSGLVGSIVGGEIGGVVGGAVGTLVVPGLGTVTGATVGALVGEVLGTIITTVACGAIVSVYSVLKNRSHDKLQEKQARELERQALLEMKNQREKFKAIVERENQIWDAEVQAGFEMILDSYCAESYDLQKVTDGIDRILAVFGKNVMFKTLEEYRAQLDMPLQLKY